jgi:4-amino-4-deoxy-L-arabinose transferase-like glycosyltransferase
MLLAIGSVALYGTALDYAPIYLHHDEVINAINAHSIVSTGRDPNGRFLPLYFHVGGNYWATPIVAYTTALFLIALPLSEFTIRLTSALVGVVGVLLMHAVARRLFQREGLAVLAAGLLALTPAYFIHSRLALDQLYPLPFVLGWLWCLIRFLDHQRLRTLFLGALLLGVGLYTYLASLITLPLYLLETWLALYLAGKASPRAYLIALAGLALPAALLVPWHLTHPTQFGQQLSMYDVYDSTRLSPAEGVGELVSYSSLKSRTSVFYNGFNPSMLFFSGGSSLINGTREAGVFLLPIAALLPVGLYRALRRLTPVDVVLLVGFVSAPLPGALVNDLTVNRMLVMLPFAILLSTVGVEAFLTATNLRYRLAGVVVLLLVPAQFAVFYRDYMGPYRLRSSFWFERNIRGAIEQVLAGDTPDKAAKVYLSAQEIPWIDWSWRFYLHEHGRADLLARTVFFNGTELNPVELAPAAVVVTDAGSRLRDSLARSGVLTEQTLIREPDGSPSFAIFERSGK